MLDAIVMLSSGISSWAAGRRYIDTHPAQEVVLLFADTLIEDEDNYRFLDDAVRQLDRPFIRLADGRTPWELMADSRIIANSRQDTCSKYLKRVLLNRWRAQHGQPHHTRTVLGVGWDEGHRLERCQARHPDWPHVAPLTETPVMDKPATLAWATTCGLRPPRMYAMGFPHANCGGFCVKAGHATFRLLYQHFPERYAYHEAQEQCLRRIVGDHSILSDRRGDGKKKPLTLRRFREEYINGPLPIDEYAYGGCGCALEEDDE